jgi:hypothetical protein
MSKLLNTSEIINTINSRNNLLELDEPNPNPNLTPTLPPNPNIILIWH